MLKRLFLAFIYLDTAVGKTREEGQVEEGLSMFESWIQVGVKFAESSILSL